MSASKKRFKFGSAPSMEELTRSRMGEVRGGQLAHARSARLTSRDANGQQSPSSASSSSSPLGLLAAMLTRSDTCLRVQMLWFHSILLTSDIRIRARARPTVDTCAPADCRAERSAAISIRARAPRVRRPSELPHIPKAGAVCHGSGSAPGRHRSRRGELEVADLEGVELHSAVIAQLDFLRRSRTGSR